MSLCIIHLYKTDYYLSQPYLLDEQLLWQSPPQPVPFRCARNPRATTFSTYYVYTLVKALAGSEDEA